MATEVSDRAQRVAASLVCEMCEAIKEYGRAHTSAEGLRAVWAQECHRCGGEGMFHGVFHPHENFSRDCAGFQNREA